MIGVFDSGSGGLTVLRALREELPSADIVYFGDIANAPYGPRSQQDIVKLTAHGIRLLQDHGAERIVSACNSMSASLALSVFDTFSLTPNDLVEMVGPAVSAFRDSPARILVCATEATIRSGMYQNAFTMMGKDVQGIAIPSLAGAIEQGEPGDQFDDMITEALAPIPKDSYDVLLLGCTHYPLAIDSFRRVLGPDKEIFDPAHAVASRAKRLFLPREVGNGSLRFLISKPSESFEKWVKATVSGKNYTIEVVTGGTS
jgi:glutamate racemase